MPFTIRRSRRALIVPLLLAVLVLSGCVHNIYAVTDGFHHSLPQKDTRIVIWGNNPAVTGSATTWLQKRGLKVVERARLLQLFEEQRIRLTHTSDDEGPILRVGKILGAGMVVFADGSTTAGVVSDYSVNKYGGEGGSQSIYSGVVTVRGVDVETSEVLWSGNARFPRQTRNSPEDALIKLACQALATAWGFRPPGDQAIASQAMCAIGDTKTEDQ
jgi:hypothetical protein